MSLKGNLDLIRLSVTVHDLDTSIEKSEVEEATEQIIGGASFEAHEGKPYTIDNAQFRRVHLNFQNERDLNDLMKIGVLKIRNKRFFISRCNPKDASNCGTITSYLLIKSSAKKNFNRTLQDLTESNIEEYFTKFGAVIDFKRNEDHTAMLRFAEYDMVDKIILNTTPHEINGVIIDVEKALPPPKTGCVHYNTNTPLCIRVSKLPHDVTSEELAHLFGTDAANIIIEKRYPRKESQSVSQSNCVAWIMNTGNEKGTRNLAAKNSSQQLHGSKIQCNVIHEPIHQFELCRKLRVGTCSHEKRCYFKHIMCTKPDDCVDKKCRYGHSRKRKMEPDITVEDEDCEDDFYRLKISNLPTVATAEKLAKLMKLKDSHSSRIIFDKMHNQSSSSKVAYLMHQPASKYLQTHANLLHNTYYPDGDRNQMKFQIEINPYSCIREDKNDIKHCLSTTDSEQSNISSETPRKRQKINEMSPFHKAFAID